MLISDLRKVQLFNYYLSYLFLISPTEVDILFSKLTLSLKLVKETGERLRGEERVEDDDARRIRDIKKSLQSPTQLQSREAALALFEKPE